MHTHTHTHTYSYTLSHAGMARRNLPTEGAYKMTGKCGGECGSYRYMAPEVFSHGIYDHKVDIYSFGVIVSELTENRHFMGHLGPIPCARAVLRGERPDVRRARSLGGLARPHHCPRMGSRGGLAIRCFLPTFCLLSACSLPALCLLSACSLCAVCLLTSCPRPTLCLLYVTPLSALCLPSFFPLPSQYLPFYI
jgi:serine/threonine protein kinase